VATIQNLVGTNKIKDEWQKINDNFAALNSAKVEKSGDTMTGPLTIRRSYPYIDLFDTDSNDIVRLVYDTNIFYVFHRDSAGNFVRTLLELSNDGTSQKVNGNQLLHAGNLPDPARLGQANVFTATQTIQGGQLIQKHSRPHHALISTDTNEGVRTEYREDQKRLRWQSTDGNGAFVAQLAYLDCQTGEIYLTPSEYKAYHAGNSGPFYRGSGSPEGVVTAPPGSIYQNTSGGTNTTLYVKRSGTGNTGWFAVA